MKFTVKKLVIFVAIIAIIGIFVAVNLTFRQERINSEFFDISVKSI